MDLWQLSATALSATLSRREVSAREVLRSLLERIDAVEPQVKAFTEILRERAADEADASDARRARGEPRGPLDGVPVTIKECFDIEGRATTLGIPAWRDHIAQRDATMVVALREAGAVVLGRTNLSQAMLFVESRNPIFGRTNNPWSLDHTPGGSSGGEAAAIAAGMSPLGVGTDIGGSIRTPCHFCGIAGLKPTLDRLPMRGYRSVIAGQEAVRGMGGPMARTVDDLSLFFRALPASRLSELDARVAPLPWQEPADVRLEGLKVGVCGDDGVLAPSAAVHRAMMRAAEVLRARGCDVRPFPLRSIRDLLSAYIGALSADGGAALVAALDGGEIDPVLTPLRRIAAMPAQARRVAARAGRALGQPNLALLLDALGGKSAGDLFTLTDRLRSYRTALLDTMAADGIRVLLAPPYATPAPLHGGSKNFTLASSYSILFNAIQLPAGVVPIGRVRHDEATRKPGRDLLERHAAKVDAGSVGLPVGVQVVGQAWRDHEVLAVMGAIESGVAADTEHPRTPTMTTPRTASEARPHDESRRGSASSRAHL